MSQPPPPQPWSQRLLPCLYPSPQRPPPSSRHSSGAQVLGDPEPLSQPPPPSRSWSGKKYQSPSISHHQHQQAVQQRQMRLNQVLQPLADATHVSTLQ